MSERGPRRRATARFLRNHLKRRQGGSGIIKAKRVPGHLKRVREGGREKREGGGGGGGGKAHGSVVIWRLYMQTQFIADKII